MGSGVFLVFIDLVKENEIDVMCFVIFFFKIEGGLRVDIVEYVLVEICSKVNVMFVMFNDLLILVLDEIVGLFFVFCYCDV